MKTDFKVKYYNTRTGVPVCSYQYDEKWEKLELFCPKCGEKSVWHQDGDGDFYVEEEYLCTSCEHSWYMPGGIGFAGKDEQDKQRLEKLKEAEDDAKR